MVREEGCLNSTSNQQRERKVYTESSDAILNYFNVREKERANTERRVEKEQ